MGVARRFPALPGNPLLFFRRNLFNGVYIISARNAANSKKTYKGGINARVYITPAFGYILTDLQYFTIFRVITSHEILCFFYSDAHSTRSLMDIFKY